MSITPDMRYLLAAVLGLTSAAVSVAVPEASHAARPTCQGVAATIVGTSGDDELVGTRGRDVVVARDGDDVVRTRGGDDLVCAGDGSDEVTGGAGADRLLGGRDRVETHPYYHRGDFMAGGPGGDLLVPGPDPRARADEGGDLLSWMGSQHGVVVDLRRGTATGEGRDRVVGPVTRVVLTQLADTFRGTDRSETVHAFGGRDDVTTAAGDDKVYPDDEERSDDDDVSTGAGDDVVRSYGGSDHLRTGAGSDALFFLGRVADLHGWAGPGRDRVEALVKVLPGHALHGGDGPDTVLLEMTGDETQDHTFDMGTGALHLGPTAVPAQVDGFEDAELYLGHFTVTGTDLDNSVTVDLGATFAGHGGDDSFSGSPEDDAFDGGAGTDTYVTDAGGTNTCTDVESDPQAVCAPTARR